MFDIQEAHEHHDINASDPYFQIICMQCHRRHSQNSKRSYLNLRIFADCMYLRCWSTVNVRIYKWMIIIIIIYYSHIRSKPDSMEPWWFNYYLFIIYLFKNFNIILIVYS